MPDHLQQRSTQKERLCAAGRRRCADFYKLIGILFDPPHTYESLWTWLLPVH
jgi:hypothetical protein